MLFLYPTSRQFPFDELCGRIVRALEVRGWKVPGFVVEFTDYGSGAQKCRYTWTIKSDPSAIDLGHHDVVLKFGRPQGTLPGGHWNDLAAIRELQIPKRCLHVYNDESGPTLDVYVGMDWARDSKTWWTRPNQRLHGDPRICVQYQGQHTGAGRRSPHLDPVRDRREYEPEGDEPRSFPTDQIMYEFLVYLRDLVLPAIEAHPALDHVAPFVEPPPIPMPTGVGPWFTYGDGSDKQRIDRGKRDVNELRPSDQFGLAGNGLRLAAIGIKRGPDLPEAAFDGFLWCGTTSTVPGDRDRLTGDVLIKITPTNARGIYVADHAAYERRRAELGAKLDGRDSFTQEEVDDFTRARACTIVSILDYKGDYEQPVYLINRELALDEVEVVGRRVTKP